MCRITVFRVVTLLAAVQSMLVLLFYRRGVFVDQWDLVPLIHQYLQHQPWLQDALALHGGHFHTSAYLLMVPLAALTNWNLLYETLLLLGFTLLSFVFLYKSLLAPFFIANTHIRYSNLVHNLIVIVVAFLFFSSAHLGNMLWSWQLAVTLVVMSLVLSVVLTSSNNLNWVKFGICLALAIIASFAFLTGFAIWPIVALQLLLHSELAARRKSAYLIVWLSIGLACVYYYFVQRTQSTLNSGTLSISQIWLFLNFYLGTCLAYFSRDVSLLLSKLGLISYLFLVYQAYQVKQHSNLFLAFVAFGLFALISGVLIAVGRLEFGIDQARSFRYIAFSQFFWISWFGLLLLHINTKAELNIKQWTVFLGICLLIIVFNAQKIARNSIDNAQAYNVVYAQLQLMSSQDKTNRLLDELEYPDPFALEQRIQMLEQYQLNFFNSKKSD